MGKTFYSVIFLPFLIILLLVSSVMGSDWVKLMRDKNGTVHSYKKVGIKKDTKEDIIVQVWYKQVFSDEGRKKYIQGLRKGMSTEGWDKLSDGVCLYEIDCNNPRYRILSITHHDTDGSVLYRGSDDKPDWEYMSSLTPLEDTLQKIVCE